MSADDAWDGKGPMPMKQNGLWRPCEACGSVARCTCAVGASVEAERRRAQFEAIERAAGASTMTIRVNPTRSEGERIAEMLKSSGLPACSLLVTNGYVAARIGDVQISVEKLRLFANDLANLVVDAERVAKAFGDRSPE